MPILHPAILFAAVTLLPAQGVPQAPKSSPAPLPTAKVETAETLRQRVKDLEERVARMDKLMVELQAAQRAQAKELDQLQAAVKADEQALGQALFVRVATNKTLLDLSKRFKAHRHGLPGGPADTALTDAEIEAIDKAFTDAREKARKQ